jgi:hypothetical protein
MRKKSLKKYYKGKRYVPYIVNKNKKEIVYYLKPETGQYNLIQRIFIHGFVQLPAGFSKSGKGFTAPVSYLLGALNRAFNWRVEIHVLAHGKVRLQQLKSKTKIFFEYNELMNVLNELKHLRHERNFKSNNLVVAFLNSQFPKLFKKSKIKYDSDYKKDFFSEIFKKKNIIKNLSSSDVDGLTDFYPRFIKAYGSRLSKRKRLIFSQKNKNTGESIYLHNIIKEFEKRLKSGVQDENKWQEFLRDYILLFNTNYTGCIEKKSISIEGDYPDFLLVNVYEYLDIYEIKKPNTALLKKDYSRDNYYWSAEIAKAISQVENYINELQRNKDAFINDVRDKTGIEIRVVKPRAYIIAGTSSQLLERAKKDDFQLLNRALKNVEVILYDDFLKSLRNLLKRLHGEKL